MPFQVTGDGVTNMDPDIDGSTRDTAIQYIVAVFTGIAWFNSLELIILIFVTFHRYKGLYFWSLLVSSLGVIPYQLGFLLLFFRLTTNNYVSLFFVTLGWYPMVTGQSVVLYSRLHLVTHNSKLLRNIKWMIAVNAVLFHTPTTVLTFLAMGPSNGGKALEKDAYSIMEKVQMTAFCLQEFFISTVYLRETIRTMRTCFSERPRKVMLQLIWINLVIISIDLILLGVEYASLYTVETTLKGIVYSIKLRLEFAVLSQLVSITNNSKRASIDNMLDRRASIDSMCIGASPCVGTNMNAMSSPSDCFNIAKLDGDQSPSSPPEFGTARMADGVTGNQDMSLDQLRTILCVETESETRRCRQDSWVQDFAYRKDG